MSGGPLLMSTNGEALLITPFLDLDCGPALQRYRSLTQRAACHTHPSPCGLWQWPQEKWSREPEETV